VAGVLNRIFVAPTLRDAGEQDTVLGWHGLLQFYVPLSLTTVVYLLAQPALTFGIARALLPERSLAVWPVLTGFLFIFNSLALSHQETSIALLTDNPGNARRLRRFTAGLAITLSGLMFVARLTPAGTWWFRGVSGLSDELLALTGAPLLILAIAPAIVTYKAWFRARYVSSGRTRVLAEGVVIYTVVLFVLVYAGSALPVPGVVAAAGAMVLSLTAEIAYLIARRPGLPPARRQPAQSYSAGHAKCH
jgi:progressive ankylosis protein